MPALPTSPMNSPFTRIRQRRAPQRQLPNPYSNLSILRRRSSRLQPIPDILGSYYESQIPIEQRPIDPQTFQPVEATSDTRVRKRRSDESVETSAERPRKLPRLTRKNLEAYESMARTRKDLKPKSSHSSRSEATSHTPATSESLSKISDASTKSISSTDSRFPAYILRNGILEQPNSKRPANIDHLQERLDRVRETASPTESEYHLTAYKIQTAENEQTVLLETSTLLKGYERGYRRVYNQPFNDFPKNIGFNNGLSPAQPDMVEGLDLMQFDLFPIREESLLEAAVPSSGPNAITLSHLAGEWKGPGKDMNLARHQAAYDGTSLVYARNEARSFLGSPDPADHAYMFRRLPPTALPLTPFPTIQLKPKASYDDFKKSRRRLRNLQDDAKETSEKLRDELNKKWSANHRSSIPPSMPAKTVASVHEDKEDPNNQLLTEYRTNFQTDNQEESLTLIAKVDNTYTSSCTVNPENNQDDSVYIQSADKVYPPVNDLDDLSMHISTADSVVTAPDATYSAITPPQSSNDTSLPLDSSEGIGHSNVRGRRRSRRTRIRTTDPVEEPGEAHHKSKVRDGRRRH